MDHGAILMLGFLVTVAVLFFWRLLLALVGVAVLMLIFVGIITLLSGGHSLLTG